MTARFAEIAFTPTVQSLQTQDGSRAAYARMQADASADDRLGEDEAEFLAAADSLYLASVSETGWPYVQHRGGPAGFLRVITPTRLAFADFRGNRQHVTDGNAQGDARVALIVMDYAQRRRLKLYGRLRMLPIESADPALRAQIAVSGYRARIERVALIDVVAFDWNCPQHITPRFTAAQVESAVQPLHERIAQLQAEVQALRAATNAAARPA